ncbi:MAG: ferritin [Elusimicrobiota bacterium]
MIQEKMLKGLNKQINAELYSAYLYLAMSAHFETVNFRGFAHWLKIQAQEELGHAMRFYGYIVEIGEKVVLEKVETPPVKWTSPLAAFTDAYKHEVKITGMINELVNMSTSLKDHATNNMLQWFVSEQVEEESQTNEIVQKLKFIGDAKGGLLMLDHQLAKRKSE